MKRAVAIVCAILAGMLPLAARQKGPSIEFEKPTRALDQVYEGETIQQSFKFTNNGDAQLEILGIEPSCGCTSALPVPNKVAPGRSGQINIEIKTESFAAQSRTLAETVSLIKTVTVRTNDPRQPQVILSVNFTVAPEIVVSEPSVFFGSSPRGKEVTRESTVSIAHDRPIKLVSAVSTDANVSVTLEPIAGQGDKKFRLIMVQKSSASEGAHAGNILIKTSSRLKPELRVSVRGVVTKGN
jgi:hypothetical protein